MAGRDGKDSMASKRLLSYEDLASYIAHSPQTLRNQVNQGTLPFPYLKVGRRVLFDRNDVDAWIAGLTRIGGAK